MSFTYKALGGLLSFRYINDVEDLDVEDLQEIYNDLEEEYSVINKNRKELKSELDKLKEVLDRKNPEEKREKIKKKLKTAKDILGDDEIPYEVRMKYIIDAYRKDQVKWGKLAEYAKHLEAEVIRLKNILITNGYTDSGDEDDSNPAKVINDLRTKVNQLKAENKELKKTMNTFDVSALECMISTFPLKAYKGFRFKSIINSQKDYINELQELLDKNDIPYALREPINSLEKEGVDEIVEDAGKYLKMHKETIEKIIEKWS